MYKKIGLTHIVELNPMQLKILIEDKAANKVAAPNFVTSGFQAEYAPPGKLLKDKRYIMYPVGILVSGGTVIQNMQPHHAPAGTLIVYKSGVVDVKPVLDITTEPDVRFAVSGCSILPKIRMREEGFVGAFSDIGRATARPVIGYNPDTHKIIIAVRPDSNIARGQATLKNLGCTMGITLDAGGSTCLRVGGKNYVMTTRRLFSLIGWDE